MRIYFKGFTNTGDLHCWLAHHHGFTVGRLYDVLGMSSTASGRVIYHIVDNNGTDRHVVLTGNIYLFAVETES